MKLTHDRLLTYPGRFGIDGLCHIRVYQQDGRLPVVIAGGLDDNPGTSVTNAIETVAHEVKRTLFADGREFRLIEHYPTQINQLPPPSFMLLTFTLSEGTPGFIDPRWTPLSDVEGFIGCPLRTWPPGRYTARAVAGLRGELRRWLLARRARSTAHQLLALVEGRC
jgi:hypothetical protein